MWDVFVSHAWEDKESIARPLANELKKVGLTVWYDEFSLALGDSLRRSIDNGLKESRYGIVILSPAFFSKKWPQKELDGLVARETENQKIILPVWHNVKYEDVVKYSPTLADKLAVSTTEGLTTVVREILQVVNKNRETISNFSSLRESKVDLANHQKYQLSKADPKKTNELVVLSTPPKTHANHDENNPKTESEASFEKISNKNPGIISTVVAVLLCGVPGIFICLFGALTAAGQGTFNDASLDPSVVFVLLCLSLIFIAIPIAVGFFTLRKNPQPLVDNEPIPPVS